MIIIKVICRCCGKVFDYDMYMGLCPKCGRVYRRGNGDRFSRAEEGILGGSFHIHADAAGLNRGIPGVEYNNAGDNAKKYVNPSVANEKRYVNAPIKGQNRYVNKQTNKPVMNKSSVTKKPSGDGKVAGCLIFTIIFLTITGLGVKIIQFLVDFFLNL